MLRILVRLAVALVLLAVLVTAIGYALPRDHVASVSREISMPPHRVFLRITDVERYPDWRKEVERVEVITHSPLTWREHAGGDVITFEMVASEPPDRLVSRIADPELPFGGTWTYELRPEGAGTRLTITERGEVYNPIFRFVSRFVLGHTATMERMLEALALDQQARQGNRRMNAVDIGLSLAVGAAASGIVALTMRPPTTSAVAQTITKPRLATTATITDAVVTTTSERRAGTRETLARVLDSNRRMTGSGGTSRPAPGGGQTALTSLADIACDATRVREW